MEGFCDSPSYPDMLLPTLLTPPLLPLRRSPPVNINIPPSPSPHPTLTFHTKTLRQPLDFRRSFNAGQAGSKTIWVNVGNSQLHLPSGPVAQSVRGTVGLLRRSGEEERLTSPDGQVYHVRPCDDPELYLQRGDYWSSGCNLERGSGEAGAEEYGMVEGEDVWVGVDYVEVRRGDGMEGKKKEKRGRTHTLLMGVSPRTRTFRDCCREVTNVL